MVLQLRLRAAGSTVIGVAIRQGRYFGEEKTDLQAVFTATMVNTKRLFTLSVGDAELAGDLRKALAA